MGIPSQLARIILREHGHRPITGTILSIARQTVYLTPEQAIALVEQELGRPCGVRAEGLERDLRTREAQGRGLVTDRAFYSLFSDAEYRCLDLTDYEGADIVANLCDPLPPHLESRFDFIVNGSCLDNMFDPATALRNMTRMLKPGGRVVHFERASRVHHVYVAFALSWFHDYYALNAFEDCQIYLVQWENLTSGRWDLYRYAPVFEKAGRTWYFGQDRYYFPYRDAHLLAIAEKGDRSTWDRSPVQFQYRANVRSDEATGEVAPQAVLENERDPYIAAALRFSRTLRAPIVAEREKISLPDHLASYAPQLPYCGSIHPVDALENEPLG